MESVIESFGQAPYIRFGRNPKTAMMSTLRTEKTYTNAKVGPCANKQETRIFTIFHRELFCWTDRWYGLTMEDIRRLEDKTKEELELVSIILFNVKSFSALTGNCNCVRASRNLPSMHTWLLRVWRKL
ncbi:unnamed protein product [Dibothriocephalus latus]|uniref:Phosphatidylinositol transfer protein N-terminal domain-containing protein n=1 Tax=Dibothriocephalus latus TaxID=60516 RepID=A0A3P7MK41_DIBLA|nr:unnamed protein product [Dibothriocephalus latus]